MLTGVLGAMILAWTTFSQSGSGRDCARYSFLRMFRAATPCWPLRTPFLAAVRGGEGGGKENRKWVADLDQPSLGSTLSHQ